MFQIDTTKSSQANAEGDAPAECAACGKDSFVVSRNYNEGTSGGLKRCTACYSVRYCGVPCQRSHRKTHKKECRKNASDRRAFNAALAEFDLSEKVDQPPSRPDCDLCMHIMPPNAQQSKYLSCCGKIICRACFARSIPNNPLELFGSNKSQEESIASFWSAFGPNRKKNMASCPFCRSSDDMVPITREDHEMRRRCLEHREDKGDPRAVFELGLLYLHGEKSVENIHKAEVDSRDEAKALEYFTKAASLGNSDAYFQLSKIYRKKYNAADFFVCLQKAADLGNLDAHNELAALATEEQKFKVAIDRYKILAAAGYSQHSLDQLTSGYKEGHISKDDLATSLRLFHAARKELASHDREVFSRFGSGVSSDGTKMIPSNLFM